MGTAKPIVFLGPSMSVEEARLTLDAHYRPPVRRGDLDDLGAGAVVGIIDGVFEQDLALSLREVQEAVGRGVVVFGGASMGALRAAEVPAVVGVGRIYEWYRSGYISRDDEVALLFDDESGRALTVPTVNVRYAVERLSRTGTIDGATADAILAAALDLPFKERTYPAILRHAAIADRADASDLIAMLVASDLKRLDAQAVLESIDRYRTEHAAAVHVRQAAPAGAEEPAASPAATADAGVLVWESGDRVAFEDVVAFLALTGRLEPVVRRVMTSGALAGAWFAPDGRTPPAGRMQELFVEAVRRWGWVSDEEAEVTLDDLGLGLASLDQYIAAVVAWNAAAAANVREQTPELLEALRAELFLDDMSLKREVMRQAALTFFACRTTDSPSPDDLREARAVLCRANRVASLPALEAKWADTGLDPAACEAFVDMLARARSAARPLAASMKGRAGRRRGRTAPSSPGAMQIDPCPKPLGEPRFSRALSDSVDDARRIAEVIGVTRIGLIGELAELGGVQIAQVARPGGAWSSSYGSGKSMTPDGAVVGGVMEEVEKWAQERFDPDDNAVVKGSYAELGGDERFISPGRLDLPYDSGYRAESPLRWYPCAELLHGSHVWLPLDVLTMRRLPHDICFSARGARKHLATNGLGSAFTLAEAVLHGMCEYIERHALRLAELFLVNPGGLGPHPYRFVDIASTSDRIRDLADRLGRSGATVKVLDITSEVAVPTFLTVIVKDGQRAEGSAAHPDPETAIEMAMLEAAQTIASAVAGAREDLLIKTRSLGRHERPRPVYVDDLWFWLDPDAVGTPVEDLDGISAGDVKDEVDWVLDRLHQAGVDDCCVLDLSREETAPARVVRAVIPGLESNNPFFTGERARLVLLRDLLPRWR